ncbi:hypothetical protein JR316_0003274 [Psilocybe cubensis]|uniref:Uncharacterized protein n=1 Tax=Psilocybe cubensis TaxID=181762 RepID=A0ACB8H800_PSICU|nr:hypothetical protein JR316_0003274 [Psilocybe cubensis]KAH9483797.1 hypothetical protein JR316_0003274 [Psilocybe cubensis]
MPKLTGLSKGIAIPYGASRTRGHGKRKHTVANKSLRQIEKEKEAQAYEISVLSFTERQRLLWADRLQSAHDSAMNVDVNKPTEDSDWEDEMEEGLRRPPPGEKGLLQSHAGGEAVMEDMMAALTPNKRYDLRTRRKRIQQRINAWQKQVPLLAARFLEWKHNDGDFPSPSEEKHSWSIQQFPEGSSLNQDHPIVFGDQSFQHLPDISYTNKTLVRHGFIGAAPEKPTIAFSLEMLAIYRQLRRVCPRFSLDALARALCYIHQLPCQHNLSDHLSSAYDCYLEIDRHICEWQRNALGRSPRWECKHVCAPCLYKTQDKAPLKYSMLAAMDGNNSLKIVDTLFCSETVRADDRVSTSWKWLTPEEADVFKDEVNKKTKFCLTSYNKTPDEGPLALHNTAASTASAMPSATQPPPNLNDNATPPLISLSLALNDNMVPDSDDIDIPWLNITELDELAKCVNTCVERWRNAGPEAQKKMFSLFAIAGIFLINEIFPCRRRSPYPVVRFRYLRGL